MGADGMKFVVHLKRTTKKRLSPDSMKEQLQFIASSVHRNATNKWKTSLPVAEIKETDNNLEGDERRVSYTAKLIVSKENVKNAESVVRRWENTRRVIDGAARRNHWETFSSEEASVDTVESIAAESIQVESAPIEQPIDTSEYELPVLDDQVMAKYFSRIYDRESHIRIIYDNLCLATKTGFQKRNHTLLHGLPACAKTELFLAFQEWLGKGLIESIDATTMTKAGLETFLLKQSKDGLLKPILLMEEIEKCHDDNVACLIQVMDSRGRIQRTNARVGNMSEECKIIIWGTCNDSAALRKFHDGAIWSRFNSKAECYRPDRNLMKRILTSEVEELAGDPQWVEVVLDFCYGELAQHEKFKKDFDDPRLAKSMLAGGPRLMDGGPKGFLADFRKVSGI